MRKLLAWKCPGVALVTRAGLALGVALVLFITLTVFVLAVPQNGHAFYGNVATAGGRSLPAGTIVVAQAASGAWTGSVNTTVDALSKYGYGQLSLLVPADDPTSPAVEGASNNDPIVFYVAGVKSKLKDVATGLVSDSYPFAVGGLTNLDLAANITFTIQAAAGTHGKIAPSGTVTVAYGDNKMFSFTPDTGYLITDVSVDGTANPGAKATGAYTFTNVTANHTITATFTPSSYTITPTAGANGTITPGTPQTVSYGGSRTFAIAANTGYVIADVGVDGVAQGPIASYTFTNVTANHAITASFKPVNPTQFDVNLPSGWNLFSIPVALASGSDTLGQIFPPASLTNIDILYRWDPQQGQWVVAGANYVLSPLEAVAVKVKSGVTAMARVIPSQDITSPPSRSLVSGLNLIGPAPAFGGSGFPPTPAATALISVYQLTGGLMGYSMAVSPNLNQPSWTYARDGSPQPDMLAYKGYWVLMQNPGTLYGSSTTPLVP